MLQWHVDSWGVGTFERVKSNDDDDDDDDDDDFSKDCSSYDDDVKQLLKSVFCILPLLMVRVLDNYFFDDRPKIVTWWWWWRLRLSHWVRCWLLQGKTTIGSWERFSLAKLTKSDAIGKYHLTRDAEFDVCALQLCVIIYDISLERLVPSFQYTTASSWQYTTSVSTMRSSSRGAERKRKRKRGDLKWRQGISIGQHSYYVASGTFVAVRCVRQAAVHSNFCKSYMCRDCNGQIRDASLYLWSWLMMMMMMMMMISVRIAQALKHNGILKSCYDDDGYRPLGWPQQDVVVISPRGLRFCNLQASQIQPKQAAVDDDDDDDSLLVWIWNRPRCTGALWSSKRERQQQRRPLRASAIAEASQ